MNQPMPRMGMLAYLRQRFIARMMRWVVNYVPAVDKGTQILLQLKYQELRNRREPLPQLRDVEFRAYSQNGEDGILLYIFALIGTTNKKAVEICAGNGIECNTANLIINHGWKALLFDGDKRNVEIGREFYTRNRDTFLAPPQFIHAWIDRENINRLIEQNGFTGEIDLLSLDLDGIDYWVWEQLTCIRPRVVVVEYNEPLGFDRLVVAYDAQFDRIKKDMRYWGATLAAYCALAEKKGYRLIGCNRQYLNAFFVRNDVGVEVLPEVALASCMTRYPTSYTLAQELKGQFPLVRV